MAHNHGSEYQVKVIHQDGTEALSEWIELGNVAQTMAALRKPQSGLLNGLNPDAISEEISRDYDAPRDVVRQHTSSFLAELERRGFVSRFSECRT
jgi:hypothetical protein